LCLYDEIAHFCAVGACWEKWIVGWIPRKNDVYKRQ